MRAVHQNIVVIEAVVSTAQPDGTLKGVARVDGWVVVDGIDVRGADGT